VLHIHIYKLKAEALFSYFFCLWSVNVSPIFVGPLIVKRVSVIFCSLKKKREKKIKTDDDCEKLHVCKGRNVMLW
jgi:hypothetical protein